MEKLLVIDDNNLQLEILKDILETSYIIKVCTNGLDGLEKAKLLQPSLILLDVIMPGMDGFDVLIQLKKHNTTKDIPVILITSLSDVGNEEKGLILGAVDYITKPFNPSIVKARVNTHTQLYAYRRTIEKMAKQDALTGIPNRRYYDEISKIEWIQAIKSQKPISIALFDIDYFKKYNDTYGHIKGDIVLKQVADTISLIFANSRNFSARYGGEEFVCIMSDTNKEQGYSICQSLCQKIQELHIPHETSITNKFLTVSIGGITVIPQKEDSYSIYFEIVDNMLYKAKNSGRNQVIWKD